MVLSALATGGEDDRGEFLLVEQRPDAEVRTADYFVQLVNTRNAENQAQGGGSRQSLEFPRLSKLILRDLHWTTLRRRQLSSLPAALENLTSFTLSGRLDAPFNGNTLARLVSPLRQLKSLALRGIDLSKHSTDGITPPSFELHSLALHDIPHLTAKHLRWLYVLPSSFQSRC